MSLKDLVAKRILEEIIGSTFKLGEWRVLVMDKMSTSIVSSCCRMHDIMSKGITLVEGLEKSRQPQPTLEAIYIIWPSEESITKMLSDFSESGRLYKGAHVYLLDRLPLKLVTKLQETPEKMYIKSLKECYIGFLPNESKVFTLKYPEAFKLLFSPGSIGKGEMKARIADQLATLCAFLGEFPTIRCHRAVDGMEDIARELYRRLEDFRIQSPSFATGEFKDQSQLIILDRGFDVVSPLLHELTYQAMVYDLLGIKKDVYTYEATTEGGGVRSRDAVLDETDPMWVEFRHKYISDVERKLAETVKQFATTKSKSSTASKNMSIKKLHQLIKEMPQHHRELSKLSRHLSLVENCDKKLKGGMFDLCKVEQDLATGETERGEKIEDPMALTIHTFFDKKIGVYEKVRLVMLQLLFTEGMPREGVIKLIQKVEVPPKERNAISNLACLGYTILKDARTEGSVVKSGRRQLRRKEREDGERYVVSRWTPLIRDIMEYAIEGRLDTNYCPILSEYQPSSSSSAGSRSFASTFAAPAQSVRSDRARWNWLPEGMRRATVSTNNTHEDEGEKPRLILFVVGGVTYSEIRVAYETAKQYPSHDVIIGSTHIVTPGDFIGQLIDLPSPYTGRI